MGMTLAWARKMGIPYPCHLSTYMHTIVYEIPGYFVAEDDEISPAVIHDTYGFRATIATGPVGFIESETFLNQYNLDTGLREELNRVNDENATQADRRLYVVIQFKEDMEAAPAVAGQCVKTSLDDGTEFICIWDCDDAPVRKPNQRTRSINTALAAIKMEYEVTEGFKRVVNKGCYLSDTDECVHRSGMNISAWPSVLSLITKKDIADRSEKSRQLAAAIEESIESGKRRSRGKSSSDFGRRLEDLIEGLLLEPSTDDSYLRLWFLRLCHRAERFGKTCKWQLRNEQKEVRAYRDKVAHPGVEKIDWAVLKSFQKELFRVIRSKL